VAIAFPNLACPGIHAACEEGDELEFDLRTGRVHNHTRDVRLQGRAFTPDMLAIVEQGGLLEVLKQRVAAGGPGPGA
jgi:3-isopropylmalate/(R)-2-methylmalate dehydratase small subunit